MKKIITLFFYSIITIAFAQKSRIKNTEITKPIDSYDFKTENINGINLYRYIKGYALKGRYNITIFLVDKSKKNVLMNQNNIEITSLEHDFEYSEYIRTYIKEKGIFSDGYKDGLWKTTYKNKLVKTVNYKSGFILGKYRVYHTNGSLLYKTNFGFRGNGKYKDYYYQTGILKEKGNYKNGKKQGEWYLYDKLGNTEKVVYYDKGSLLKNK